MAHPDEVHDFRGSIFPKIAEEFHSTQPPKLAWDGIEKRGMGSLPPRCHQDIAQGICEGARQILQDKELLKGFWQAGFDEGLNHLHKKGTQWIGSKILSWIMTSLLLAALAIAGYLLGRK
jgi:hypothetical protein